MHGTYIFVIFYILMPKIYYGDEFSLQLVLIIISLNYIVYQ